MPTVGGSAKARAGSPAFFVLSTGAWSERRPGNHVSSCYVSHVRASGVQQYYGVTTSSTPWVRKHPSTDASAGSRAPDTRSATVCADRNANHALLSAWYATSSIPTHCGFSATNVRSLIAPLTVEHHQRCHCSRRSRHRLMAIARPPPGNAATPAGFVKPVHVLHEVHANLPRVHLVAPHAEAKSPGLLLVASQLHHAAQSHELALNAAAVRAAPKRVNPLRHVVN